MAFKQRGRQFIPDAVLGKTLLQPGAFSAGGGGAGLSNVIHSLPFKGCYRERVFMGQLTIDVAAANDFASAELCVLPDAAILVYGVALHGGDAANPLKSSIILQGFTSNAGSALDVGIGTAAAAATPLAGTAIDIMQKVDGTDVSPGIGLAIGQTDAATLAVGKKFDKSATNKLFINVADAVTSGTGVVAFVNCWVDVYFAYLGAGTDF